MYLIPYQKTTLFSTLQKKELLKNLQTWPLSDYHWHITKDGIELKLLNKIGYNSFLPTAKVIINELEHPLKVHLYISLAPVVYLFLTLITIFQISLLFFDFSIAQLLATLLPYALVCALFHYYAKPLKHGIKKRLTH